MIEKSTGAFLGWFHYRLPPDGHTDDVELGYRLRRSAWGKGYATEGSRALVRYVRTFHREWPQRIPGDEHGDVEYALTWTEWEHTWRDYAGAATPAS